MSVKASAKSKAPAKAKAPVKAKAARKSSPKKAAVKKVTAKPKPKFAQKKPSAKPIKGVDAPVVTLAPDETVVVAAVGKGKRVGPALQTANVPAKVPVTMPALQTASVPEHTMARSYVRSTGAGKGKLRDGGKYQCTVSFTPDQMAMIVAAAQFRNVSLAELIRSHVVQNLTPVTLVDGNEG